VPDEHSDLVGGSTAGRRLNCPASYLLEQKVPKVDGSSDSAREGTVLHELMTKVLLDPELDPYDILPFSFTHKEGWTHTVDVDTWESLGEPALNAFLDYMDGLENEAGAGAEFQYIVEKRCAMPGIPGAYGTADIIWKCGKYAGVWDWKFGYWGVPATDNPQLQFYARAAMESHPEMFDGVEVIELAIMQPQRNERPDTWQTTAASLEDFRMRLIAAVTAAQQPGARMAKGTHCKYARCMAVCPLYLDPTLELAKKLGLRKQQEAEVIEAGERPLAPDEAIDDGETFVEMLPDLLELAEAAEAYAAEVFSRAHDLAEGDSGARDYLRDNGWVLKAKRPGARKWALPEKAILDGARNRGLKLDDVAPRKLSTPKKVEDLLAGKGKKMPEGWAVVPPSSGTTLVRQTGEVKEHRNAQDTARDLGERLRKLR
jgi:hypothetical protein